MISARDLAFVGCRLLALYVFYGFLLYGAYMIYAAFLALAAPGDVRANMFIRVNDQILSVAANLVMFVALWFGARRISRLMAAGTAEPAGEQVQTWSRESALSLAVVVLGLWILVHHFPVLLSYAPLMFPDPSDVVWRDVSVHPPSIISAFLTSALGLLCVLTPRGIANFIARLRRW